MKAQTKTRLLTAALLLTLALSTIAPIALADSPTIGIKSLGETSGSLAKDADASVHMIMEWENFAANKTVDFRIYNSTGDLLATPETGYVIHVTSNATGTPTVITDGDDDQGADGEYETTYTVSGLAESVGTWTYTLKVLDNSDNTTLASQAFTVLVAEEDISLAVSMEDADGDDVIEKDESVVFTAYYNWVSVSTAETHTLWVSYDDGTFVNKDSVSITAGAGSDTGTFTYVWNTEGDKTVDVELRDPSGTAVASLEIPLTVGEETPETVTSTPSASQVSTTPIWQNPIVLGTAFLAAIAVTALLAKRD